LISLTQVSLSRDFLDFLLILFVGLILARPDFISASIFSFF